MANVLYEDVKHKYMDLVGQPDGTIDARGTRNIRDGVKGVLNKYKFSWNKTTATISLVAGVATLPTDYNPVHNLDDARIDDDNVFTKIEPSDRSNYTEDSLVYWITFDKTTNTYIFNSLTQTGNIDIIYWFIPDAMTADADVCVIPDIDAIGYEAASRHWIGAERDVELKREYEQEANKYILALYVQDISSQEYSVNSVTVINEF